MNKLHTCHHCKGRGRLKVKHEGFSRRYYVKCHDCKAETILTYTPDKAIFEWNNGWIFDTYLGG